MVHLIPSVLVWAEIVYFVYVALTKWPINQFKPVQQSRQQWRRAYCPNIYTVYFWVRVPRAEIMKNYDN